MARLEPTYRITSIPCTATTDSVSHARAIEYKAKYLTDKNRASPPFQNENKNEAPDFDFHRLAREDGITGN